MALLASETDVITINKHTWYSFFLRYLLRHCLEDDGDDQMIISRHVDAKSEGATDALDEHVFDNEMG